MHNTPNKSPNIKYKYIKYVHAFYKLQHLHMKNEEEMTRVAAQ
jgi:hypothetical protein